MKRKTEVEQIRSLLCIVFFSIMAASCVSGNNIKEQKRQIAVERQSSPVVVAEPDTAEENGRMLAFPGAEGGGRFVTGGKGGHIYHVTTLADYGKDEQLIQGSYRAGIHDNTIIVFDVAGTIHLKQPVSFKNCKNITLAGQTAPGDGITFAGFETNITNVDNMIIRYLRFRPGTANVFTGDSMDALWGRPFRNVMIDHCSFSWSTDEGLSPYRGENFTVQWCLIYESLTMSGHTKGRHGYGGIWGGVNATFHHNLLACHTSRNPRIGGGTFEKDDNDHIGLLQISNCIIYNWGFNTCYGGGRCRTNFINNYEKTGPGTRDEVRNRIIDAGEYNKPGWFYVQGNYLEGNPVFSQDNSKGIYISDASRPTTTITDKPFEMEGNSATALKVEPAEACYEKVLLYAGATLPRRDALDARIISEVRNGTGRFINTDYEVGGYPADEITSGYKASDTIPATDFFIQPENPEVTIVTPAYNQQVEAGSEFTVKIKVNSGNPVKKIALYKEMQKIQEEDVRNGSSGSYKFNLTLSDPGACFITVKVTDSKGNATFAESVNVQSIRSGAEANLGVWKKADIGRPAVPVAAWVVEKNADKILTVAGTGKLGREEGAVNGTPAADAAKDTCAFVYQPMNGDGVLTAKLDSVIAVDNHAFAGLMVRQSLNQDAAAVGFGLSWVKSTSYKTGKQTFYRDPWAVYLCGRNTTGGSMDKLSETLDSEDAAVKAGIKYGSSIHFKDRAKELGCFMKLERKGNEFTASYSLDGKVWIAVGSRTVSMDRNAYIGFAVDSNQVANALINVNHAVFSQIDLRH